MGAKKKKKKKKDIFTYSFKRKKYDCLKKYDSTT